MVRRMFNPLNVSSAHQFGFPGFDTLLMSCYVIVPERLAAIVNADIEEHGDLLSDKAYAAFCHSARPQDLPNLFRARAKRNLENTSVRLENSHTRNHDRAFKAANPQHNENLVTQKLGALVGVSCLLVNKCLNNSMTSLARMFNIDFSQILLYIQVLMLHTGHWSQTSLGC